jgi:hypothetical protein
VSYKTIRVPNADGKVNGYRRVGSVIEHCWIAVGVWTELRPNDYPRMTPAELRAIADLIELPSHPQGERGE